MTLTIVGAASPKIVMPVLPMKLFQTSIGVIDRSSPRKLKFGRLASAGSDALRSAGICAIMLIWSILPMFSSVTAALPMV